MIEISNLSFRYREGAEPILHGIDLAIPDGSFVGITGAAGSGKSTLTYAFNGIIPHCYPGDFYGSVTIDGLDTCEASLTDISRLVGSVCQDIDSQMVSSVVEDEVLYGLENFGVPKDQVEGRIAEALEAMGISDLRHRGIAELSGGQKQKVAVASVIALKPRVLVLDEPTSFLDIRYKIELSAILLHLAREQGVTIVMSLHEIDLAARVSDLVMGIGTHGVEMFGAPEAVFTEENITQLYGISSGVYDALSGSMELPRAEGAPYAFVLGGMGKATTVYRRLTREGTPFATGILAENDMDIPAARHLAARILTTAPFAPPSEAVLTEARQTLLNCGALLIPDGLEAHAWDDELICFAQEHCVEVRHA